MNRSSLFVLLAILCLYGAPDLLAQPHPAAKSAQEPEAVRKVDTVEAEASLPTYSEAELARLVVYPDEARKNGIQGPVVVVFVVDTAGRATRVEAVESPDALLSQAAVDAIRQLPFTPAYNEKRKAVRLRMTITINFQLQ